MNDISNSLNVPLGEQDHLKQFFTIFQENPKVEHKVEEIGQLVSYIDDLKSQMSDAYEEIQYIRDTLQTMQDKTLKAKVGKYVAAANEQMEKVKTTYQNTKENVQQTIGQAVKNAKNQGIKVVDKAVDVLHVRKALETMKECLKKAANSLGEGLRRLERAGKEVDAIKTHIGNFGKALAGRSENAFKATGNEKIVTKQNKDRGLIQDLHKALSFCKGQVEGMEKKTLGAIDTLEHLHRLPGSKDELPTSVGEREVSELQIPKQR